MLRIVKKKRGDDWRERIIVDNENTHRKIDCRNGLLDLKNTSSKQQKTENKTY
jgi:hypothetical protein